MDRLARRSFMCSRAIAMAFLAGLLAAPVAGAGPAYEFDKNYEVTVDGEAIEGAKVFRGNRAGNLLLVVPAESKRFLLDALAGTVFAVREEDVVISSNGATAKVRERFAWSVPLARDRDSSRFLLGPAEVSVTWVDPKPEAPAPDKAASRPPAADPATPGAAEVAREPAVLNAPATQAPERDASGPAASKATTDSTRRSGSSAPAGTPPGQGAGKTTAARECVSLETRPAMAVPGCSRYVFLRNTCDAPVIAQMQRTEHLMTGTLPQLFTETVPAGSELGLGCSWWSGAMAPAQHQIVGASFLP